MQMGEKHKTKNRFVFDELKNNKKFNLVLTVIVLIVLAFVIVLIFYSTKNNSAYTELTTTSYSTTNNKVSFQYPSIMKFDSTLVSKLSRYNTPLIYSTKVTTKTRSLEALSYLSVTQILSLLKLSQVQLLNQIKKNSGDYIDLLNIKNPNLYKQIYGNCNKSITNVNNQTGLICTSSANGMQVTRVIGINKGTQYSLEMDTPTNIWNDNTDVWSTIEKSFTY
jgi:hypothetical protein